MAQHNWQRANPVYSWAQAASMLALAVLIQSCGEPKSAETLAQKVARAEQMSPVDPVLAEKYARSCRGCHIIPDSGAPLTGDKAEWAKRFAAGDDQVLRNAQNGIRMMPARGLCLDCSDEELWQLTLFMSGRKATK